MEKFEGVFAVEWKKQMTRIGKALLTSMLLTGILLLVMAWILYQTNLSGLAEHVMVIVIYVLACLVGGFLLGKQEEKRRFLWGAGFGAVYFFLLLLLAAAMPGADPGNGILSSTGFFINWSGRLRVLLICLLGGMAGGMLS